MLGVKYKLLFVGKKALYGLPLVTVLPLLLRLILLWPHWFSYYSWKTPTNLASGPLYMLFLKPERHLHQNFI